MFWDKAKKKTSIDTITSEDAKQLIREVLSYRDEYEKLISTLKDKHKEADDLLKQLRKLIAEYKDKQQFT